MDTSKILQIIHDEIRQMNNELNSIRDELKIIDNRVKMMENNSKVVNDILVNHISFVNGRYNHYKGSLDYIKDRVSYLNPLRLFYSNKKIEA